MYDAFGNELTKNADNTNPNESSYAGISPNPFRFNGEYLDQETNTYYLRARHFNPRTGRFTQPDPHWNTSNMIFGDSSGRNPDAWAIVQTANLFIYATNNPVRFIDPSGRINELPRPKGRGIGSRPWLQVKQANLPIFGFFDFV